ncbi:hypothetical protein JW848_00860 [Candidatus Bipolaricaulota bacterium]|nr:hypothetical protein [Candidatus Bipolaricaulota bacterium]
MPSKWKLLPKACVVCIAVLAASAGVLADSLDLCLPADATTVDVQTTAERIVLVFVSRTAEVLGATLASDVPSVAVRNTPNLAYFDHREGEIVLAHWGTLEEPLRMFFVSLTASDDLEQTSRLFTSLFNGFLVAHEMAHWLQHRCDAEMDRYTSESMANDLAVVFFVELEGGEEALVALRETIAQAIEHLVDPTPSEEDAAVYFNAHYAELARDPYQYGYFQFRFIIESIDQRDRFDFEKSVRSLCRF